MSRSGREWTKVLINPTKNGLKGLQSDGLYVPSPTVGRDSKEKLRTDFYQTQRGVVGCIGLTGPACIIITYININIKYMCIYIYITSTAYVPCKVLLLQYPLASNCRLMTL